MLGAKTLVAGHGCGLFRHVLFIVGDTLKYFGSDFVLLAVAIVVRVASAALKIEVCRDTTLKGRWWRWLRGR